MVSGVSILTIDDDHDMRGLLRRLLEAEGYSFIEAETARGGIRSFHKNSPDLVILDIDLPDLNGLQTIERIRDMSDAPIVVLSTLSSHDDKVRCLNAGADDYLTKPFSRVELLVRLQALLRRCSKSLGEQVIFEDKVIRVDFKHHQVMLTNTPNPVKMTPTEYRLLTTLINHKGQVLSSDQLVKLVWESSDTESKDRVKYAILRLRKKLDTGISADNPIETVRGFGYRYRELA